MDTTQAMQEFLAKGGSVTKCEAGSKTTTTKHAFIHRDPKMRTLKALLIKVKGNEASEQKVELAIQQRKRELIG